MCVAKNFLLFIFITSLYSSVQSQDIGYEVQGIYSKVVKKENLNGANTISDINPGFPASWISHYISVELLATCNGLATIVSSSSHSLSAKQKELLSNADLGTSIIVDVKYNPKSSTDDVNEIKDIKFSYRVVPHVEAEYHGGYGQLQAYLKSTAIDKIAETGVKEIELVIVKFAVDESGKAMNGFITNSSGNEKLDQLFLNAIANMPKWKPAQNLKGENVKQEFEFRVGNLVGC